MSYSTLSINDKDGFRLDIFNDNIWDLPDFDPDAPDSLIVRLYTDSVSIRIINPNDDMIGDFFLTKNNVNTLIAFLNAGSNKSSLRFSTPNDGYNDTIRFTIRNGVLDITIDTNFDDTNGDITINLDYRITLKNYLSDLIKKL